MDSNQIAFGELLRKQREAARCSKAEVARVLGTTPTYVRMVECARTGPLTVEHILKAAELFEVSPLALLRARARHYGSITLALPENLDCVDTLINLMLRLRGDPADHVALGILLGRRKDDC